MTNWYNLPTDLRRLIIYMGNDICSRELILHRQLFEPCLLEIKKDKKEMLEILYNYNIRYWIRWENPTPCYHHS